MLKKGLYYFLILALGVFIIIFACQTPKVEKEDETKTTSSTVASSIVSSSIASSSVASSSVASSSEASSSVASSSVASSSVASSSVASSSVASSSEASSSVASSSVASSSSSGSSIYQYVYKIYTERDFGSATWTPTNPAGFVGVDFNCITQFEAGSTITYDLNTDPDGIKGTTGYPEGNYCAKATTTQTWKALFANNLSGFGVASYDLSLFNSVNNPTARVHFVARFNNAKNVDITKIMDSPNLSNLVRGYDRWIEYDYNIHTSRFQAPADLSSKQTVLYMQVGNSPPYTLYLDDIYYYIPTDSNYEVPMYYEPFDYPVDATLDSCINYKYIHNLYAADRTWAVGPGSTNYYLIKNTSPLTYNNLVTTSTYANGGYDWVGCYSRLENGNSATSHNINKLTDLWNGEIIGYGANAVGKTVWVSGLFRVNSPAGTGRNYGFGCGTETNNNQNRFAICYNSTRNSGNFTLKYSVNTTETHVNTSVPCVIGQTYFVVFKITFGDESTTWDKCEMFINPSLNSTPTVPDAQFTASDTTVKFTIASFGFHANFTANTASCDEIRCGLTYKSVAPTN